MRLTSIALLLSLPALPAAAQDQKWIQQFGTSTKDSANAAAQDGSGGVYVGGSTLGSLGGPNMGAWDGWLARYDHAGSQLWIRQLGSSATDYVHSSAQDGAGGMYVCGSTEGNLVHVALTAGS